MRQAIKALILLVVGLCLLPLGWFLIASVIGMVDPTPSASVEGLAGILVLISAFAIAGAGLSSAMTGARFGNRGLKNNSLLSKEGQTPIAVYQQTMVQVKQENDAMGGKPKDEEHPPATRRLQRPRTPKDFVLEDETASPSEDVGLFFRVMKDKFPPRFDGGAKVTIGTYRPATKSYEDANRKRIRNHDQDPCNDTNRRKEDRYRG